VRFEHHPTLSVVGGEGEIEGGVIPYIHGQVTWKRKMNISLIIPQTEQLFSM
jgi:hypothetical protein